MKFKSRKSFIAYSTTIYDPSDQHRIRKWREELQCEKPVLLAEHLPCGGNQPWITWKTINVKSRSGQNKSENYEMGTPERTGYTMQIWRRPIR
ncbi:Hypothetical protein CINCED_3A004995 [Cinara cedri]|uniref:Uncharacterized protein n=1 Tax=Cinara cedri TaxID=506608 RepID=A0A5E4MNM1_9HEMI|nr:Hypothetical protein CINCED_3A004995 [Cinara cedri]